VTRVSSGVRLGKLGHVYREIDEEHADKATVIRDISAGQYSKRAVRDFCAALSLAQCRSRTNANKRSRPGAVYAVGNVSRTTFASERASLIADMARPGKAALWAFR